MGNPVVHFEINAPDEQLTAKFYSELFGWHTEAMGEMSYVLVDTHSGGGINGGLGRTTDGTSVLFYVAVPDPQATIDKAVSLGGEASTPVTEIPDVVTFASFRDPEGHEIGLVKDSTDEGPGVSAGANPQVGWFEIGCTDPKKMWDFYTSLFGWKINAGEGSDFVYGEVDTQAGHGIGGGIGSLPPGTPPYVTLYVDVDDVQKYLDRVEDLGGKTMVPPMQVHPSLEIAIFLDAQGVMLGLFHQG